MGVKIKKKTKGKFIKRLKRQKKQYKREISIGYFDPEVLEYAPAHEFGARIKVTQKMRRFFMYMAAKHPGNWYPLKGSTKFIIIPKRSTLGGFIKNKKGIRQEAIDFLNGGIIKGKKPKFETYINKIVKKNKLYYNSITTPKKSELGKFQSGTDQLLKSNRNKMFKSLEGKVSDG